MTQPNPFLPAQPQPQQPAGPPNPFTQPQQGYAPPAAPQQPQNPYGAPAQNGGSPWPAGATAGAPGLVAQPGQFVMPSAPPEGGSANMPKIKDLQARLLLIMPEKKELQVPGKYDPQDRLTATVVVLDGGPLTWGGQTQGSQPGHGTPPFVIKSLWIQQSKLIAQLEEALQLRLSGGPGLSLGRLWKAGTAHNDPFVLAPPNPQDVEVYNRYVSQVNPFTL